MFLGPVPDRLCLPSCCQCLTGPVCPAPSPPCSTRADCGPVFQAQPAAPHPPAHHSLLQGLYCGLPRILSAAVHRPQWRSAGRGAPRQRQLCPGPLARSYCGHRPRGSCCRPGNSATGVPQDNRRSDQGAPALQLRREAREAASGPASAPRNPFGRSRSQAGGPGLLALSC